VQHLPFQPFLEIPSPSRISYKFSQTTARKETHTLPLSVACLSVLVLSVRALASPRNGITPGYCIRRCQPVTVTCPNVDCTILSTTQNASVLSPNLR
jgi:hypothetical protein